MKESISTEGCVNSLARMDSTDDAYYSDMTTSNISVTSGPVSRRSHQKHHRRHHDHTLKLVNQNTERENSSPDSDDSNPGQIFSFRRTGSEKIALNKGTSLPSELKELDGETCDCHCGACCSCRSNHSQNRHSQGCPVHNFICKKLSDGADCQVSTNKETQQLPSPTAIESWGHFSKHRGNHYKYRRSDYSSDSDEESAVGSNKKNLKTQMLVKQKSHLPSLTLTRQSSSSSARSYDKSLNNSIDPLNSMDGVNPLTFKERVKTMVRWFSDFNDEQKNLMLKELLMGCELPQLHLLSVKMEANLHHGCPPNCQDLLTWLPTNQATKILSYLDPVSLCRACQVCKVWSQLSEEQSLWRRFCCQPKWRLCKAAEHKQWKKVFAERYRLRNNWLKGRCTVRTFEGHSQGISCWSVQTLVGHSGTVRCLHLEGNRLVSGSTDCMIKVWDLSTQESWSSIACKVTMTGHSDTFDATRIVSGSLDCNLKFWDVHSGECINTIDWKAAEGHTGVVRCLQADSWRLVWNLETGKRLVTLRNHTDGVTCLQFNDFIIVSGSYDKTVKLWDFSSC
ncbi:SCONB-like protein [Mya arenaria]|uniref:SCONB-like protein n=1 Tax=Mya arenaria TaxID=6604 RepID=A0ABY7G0V4_MYAAR|nr:SCONB-like protein [Mya arenaria]